MEIHQQVFDTNSPSRLHLLGVALSNMVILPEYRTAYITLSQQELDDNNFKKRDTEGFVNYNLSLRGVNFGVLMKEGDEGTKLSFRSIGSFPCNEFAAHFNGGGHYNASGGRVELNLAETEKKFLSLLEEYKDKLDY